MSASRTKFYLDKHNAKLAGVCSGISDYSGIDVVWVRVAVVLLTIMGSGMTLIAYALIAWFAEAKPKALYASSDEARFWQGVRSNPSASARDIKARFRELDRRLADIETYYTSHNQRLADEIDSLR